MIINFSSLLICSLIQSIFSDNYTASLLEDLLKDYDNVVRPVENSADNLKVYLGIKLSQIADIDERNQIMTTNVWVRHVITHKRFSNFYLFLRFLLLRNGPITSLHGIQKIMEI